MGRFNEKDNERNNEENFFLLDHEENHEEDKEDDNVFLPNHEEDKEDDNFFLLNHEEDQKEDNKEDSLEIEQNEDNSSFISSDDELYSWLSEGVNKNEAQSVLGQGDEEPIIMLDDEEEKQKEEIKKEAGHVGGFDDKAPEIIEKKEAGHVGGFDDKAPEIIEKKETGHIGGFDDVPPLIIEKKEDADISGADYVEPEKDQEKEKSYWDKYYDQEMKNARTDEEAMHMAAMKDFKLNTPKPEDEEEARHIGGFDDVPPLIIEKKEDADISGVDNVEPEKDQEKEYSYWDKYYDQEMKNARTDEEAMHMAAMKDFKLNTPMPEDEEEEQKEENKEVQKEEQKEENKEVQKEVQKEEQKEDVNEEDSFVIAMDEADDKEENKNENKEDDSFVIAMDEDEPEPVNKKEAQMKVLAAAKINKNLMDAFQKILDKKKDGKANSDLYNNIIDEYVEAMNAQTPSEFVMHMRHLSDACVNYVDNRHPISQEGKERKKNVNQLHQVVEEMMPEINEKLDTFEVVDKDKVIGEIDKELGDDISKEDQRKVWAATKINKNLMDAFQKILDKKKDGKANSDLYNNIIDEYVEAMNAQTQSEFVMHMRHLSDACVKYADKRNPISQEGKERKKNVEQLHQIIEEEIMPEITKKLDTFEVVEKDKVNGEMLKESADKPLVEKTSFNNILDDEGINTARKTKVTLTNKDKSNSNTLKK